MKPILITGIFVFIISISCNPTKVKQAKIERINILIEKGDYEEAISRLDDLIEKYPNGGFLFEKRGYCYDKVKYYLKAIDDYSSAIKYGSQDSAQVYYMLGKNYASIHKDSLAINYLMKANSLKANKNVANLIDSLTSFPSETVDFTGEKMSKTDIENTIKWVERDINSPITQYYNLIKPLSLIIRNDSTNAVAYFLRSISYSNCFYYLRSISDNQRALQLHYKNPKDIYYNLGCNYLALQDEKNAIKFFNLSYENSYEDLKQTIKIEMERVKEIKALNKFGKNFYINHHLKK